MTCNRWEELARWVANSPDDRTRDYLVDYTTYFAETLHFFPRFDRDRFLKAVEKYEVELGIKCKESSGV